MADQLRGERLQIMLTEEELAALDDWRFARRMPSRAAAVRELLRRGLAAEGVVLNDGRMRSKDFGVTDGAGRDEASQRRDGDGFHAHHGNGTGRRTNGDGADH
jgi:hypothetical protein